MKLAAVLVVAALAAACSRTEAPKSATLATRTLDAGLHRVEVRMPANWDVASRETALTLHAPFAEGGDAAQVLLVDFAAATPKGMRDEVFLARELWRAGDIDAARKRLHAIPVGSPLLPGLRAPSAYASAWSRLLHPPGNMTIAQADEHFDTLLAGIEASASPSVEAVADWALPIFDGTRLTSVSHTSGGRYEGQEVDTMAGRHDARRRDLVTRTTRTVNGREAVEFETRDNLTHGWRRRMTFVVHADRLLVIASTPATEPSFAAYDGVRDSLVFRN